MSKSLAASLLLTLVPLCVLAEPVPSVPVAFSPRTGDAAQTGHPVIMDSTRLLLSSGAAFNLEPIDPSGLMTPDVEGIFRLSGGTADLVPGTPICRGTGEAPSFLAFDVLSLEPTVVRFGFYGPGRSGKLNQSAFCRQIEYEAASAFAPDLSEVRLAAEPSIKGAIGNPDPAGAKPASARRTPGKWKVVRSTNPIDDTPTVVLSLVADEGRNQWNRPISFIARCQSDTTEAYAVWNTYVGDDSSSVYDEWKYVEVRLGDGKAVRQRWEVSTDNEATFVPGWAGAFLKDMLGSGSMVLRVTPYGENPITAVFDTSGLDAVLPELAETCNWQVPG